MRPYFSHETYRQVSYTDREELPLPCILNLWLSSPGMPTDITRLLVAQHIV